MITHYTYRTQISTSGSAGPLQLVDVDFNDVTGEITNLTFGDVIPSDDGIYPNYGVDELIFANADWELRSSPSFVAGVPFGPYAKSLSVACTIVLDGVDKTTDDSLINGAPFGTASITINATYGGSAIDYRLTGPGYDSGWLSDNVFTDLLAGDYVAYVRQGDGDPDCIEVLPVTIYYTLSAQPESIDSTGPGISDGTIIVRIYSSSGSYEITIGAVHRIGNTITAVEEFDNYAPGTYHIRVDDLITGQFYEGDIAVDASRIILPSDSFFQVPWFQSLQFVHEVDTDECDVLQTLDNVRFCKQFFEGMTEAIYAQKVCKCDAPTIQIKSNYSSHKLSIIRYSDDVLINDTTPVIKKIPNIGVTGTFDIVIKNNGAGTSRVYFTSLALPIVLAVDDVFAITDNVDGFDGNYTIISIGVDTVTAAQYLVINLNYGIVPTSSTATGVFVVTSVDFDIYETTINFSLLPDNEYYVKIEAFDVNGDLGGIPALSEPIDLKTSHPSTNLVRWYNYDAAFDMNYSTELQSFMRVDSIFFKRNPGGLQDALRNTTGEPRVIRGQFQRKAVFQISYAPPWVMEKMGIALVLTDKKFIQGQEIYSEAMPTPSYEDQFRFATVDVPIEIVNTFETYNKSDLDGTEVDGNLIIANGGAILRTQE